MHGYGKFKVELLGSGIRYVIVIPYHITLAAGVLGDIGFAALPPEQLMGLFH